MFASLPSWYKNNPALFKAVMCQIDTMQEAYAKVGKSCDSPAPKLTAAQAQAISNAKMEALKANAVANLNLATTNNNLNSRVVAKPKANTGNGESSSLTKLRPRACRIIITQSKVQPMLSTLFAPQQ